MPCSRGTQCHTKHFKRGSNAQEFICRVYSKQAVVVAKILWGLKREKSVRKRESDRWREKEGAERENINDCKFGGFG